MMVWVSKLMTPRFPHCRYDSLCTANIFFHLPIVVFQVIVARSKCTVMIKTGEVISLFGQEAAMKMCV